MLLNKVLFPAPNPPHYTLTSHIDFLFWIPADSAGDAPIPCMFYSPRESQRKIEYFMIFSHGNGCDIGSMQYTLNEFCQSLNIYIISFEYPSYGVCTVSSPNQRTINRHADRTYDFVRNTLHWPAERILIYGHSIGSGTGCHLASTRAVTALILQSPYTSIANIVKEKVGLLSLLVGTRSWDNLAAMNEITCPILFIHGLDDNVIPSHHSQTLYDACTSRTEANKLVLLRQEHHNSMSEPTLLRYIRPFLEKRAREIDPSIPSPRVTIPAACRDKPQALVSTDAIFSSTSTLSSWFAMSRAATTATLQAISGKKSEEHEKRDDL